MKNILKYSIVSVLLFAWSMPLMAEDEPSVADAEPEVSEPASESLMDQPMDGTSLEAFQAGLTRLEEEGYEREYRQLQSAISFLLFYDLEVQRDKERLYAKLDGRTPNEIINDVKSRRIR